MITDVATIFAAAEKLPAEQRRELIELLELGLDNEVTTPALSEAWWRVIEHRSAEYAAGRAETVPWSEVLARWAQLPASGVASARRTSPTGG